MRRLNFFWNWVLILEATAYPRYSQEKLEISRRSCEKPQSCDYFGEPFFWWQRTDSKKGRVSQQTCPNYHKVIRQLQESHKSARLYKTPAEVLLGFDIDSCTGTPIRHMEDNSFSWLWWTTSMGYGTWTKSNKQVLQPCQSHST
jgi:hypothetical protein